MDHRYTLEHAHPIQFDAVLGCRAGGRASLASPVTPPVAAAADETQHVGFHSWDSTAQLAHGRLDGTKVDHGRISMVRATGTTATPTRSGTARRGLRHRTWTSPVVDPGFGLTELVASWNATRRTAPGSRSRCAARPTPAPPPSGTCSAAGPSRRHRPTGDIHRTSVAGAGRRRRIRCRRHLRRPDRPLRCGWQLQVTLYRPQRYDAVAGGPVWSARWRPGCPPTRRLPRAPSAARRASTWTYRRTRRRPTSGTTRSGTAAARPGARPTSTAMVLDYWAPGRRAEDTAWVDPSYADPQVDHSARIVFDYSYDGAGNWPFNTAYAGTCGLDGVRHPAAVADRGGAVHQGGHPAGRVAVVQEGRADRRRLRDQRAPDGDRRLRPQTATWSSTTRRRT